MKITLDSSSGYINEIFNKLPHEVRLLIYTMERAWWKAAYKSLEESFIDKQISDILEENGITLFDWSCVGNPNFLVEEN